MTVSLGRAGLYLFKHGIKTSENDLVLSPLAWSVDGCRVRASVLIARGNTCTLSVGDFRTSTRQFRPSRHGPMFDVLRGLNSRYCGRVISNENQIKSTNLTVYLWLLLFPACLCFVSQLRYVNGGANG